jgi:hypothetical protein
MLVMASCGKSGITITALAVLLALLTPAIASGADSKHKPDFGPPATTRIPVEPLGYAPPSRFYMVYRHSSTTLNFIDKEHLLFTFRSGRLLSRLPGDPPDDEDQMVHAAVLEIASGKCLQETDWRMHDRQRYLWALGDGQFLVRQRNSLFLTNRELELRPYLSFETPLQLVQLTPDRKLMMLEMQKRVPPDAAPADPNLQPSSAGSGLAGEIVRPRPRVDVVMLRPGDRTVIAQSEARRAVDLPLLDDSILQVLEGKQPNKWVLQKMPFHGEPQIIAEIKSACTPTLVPLSENVALTVGCFPTGGDRSVTAVSLKGNLLWQNRWQQRYIWPTFEYAQDGSRFAYASLEVAHDLGMADPFGDGDVVAQLVGVFDTESGKLELVKDATPVLSSGQNYALSADGRRFAILREGAIEVYDLPPVDATPAPAPATNSQTKTEPSKNEPAKTAPSLPAPPKTDPSKTDLPKN